MNYNKKLVLEDKTEFKGIGYGANVNKVGEIVFNTSMVGYQEISMDPAYSEQIVVITYPLIGNYGVNDEDNESKSVKISGLVCGEYNDQPSNFRATNTLSELLEESNVPLISGLDTRMLTRILRDKGSMIAVITDIDTPMEECMKMIKEYKKPSNLISQVSCKKRWISRCKNPKFNVVLVDFGACVSQIKALNSYGCTVTVVPYNTSAEDILEMLPDGVVLLGGPEDVNTLKDVSKEVKKLIGKVPLFGISTGCQLIGLAYGTELSILKIAHRGGNHPVRILEKGNIEIVSQTHAYALDDKSISKTKLKVTHLNVLDNSVEGVECKEDYVFAVQYLPSIAAGPEDAKYLYQKFINTMISFKEVK